MLSRRTGLIIVLLLIACTGLFHTWKHYGVQPPGLIRLHVVANSNTFFDQNLKYQVKERIVRETSATFRNATNAEEARVLADTEAARIESMARDEIQRHGYNYPVRVERGTYYFPVKTYTLQNGGSFSHLTLLPGRYEAVRVVIGNGRGANWWCVLYPPLCFTSTRQALPPLTPSPASAVEKTDEAEDLENQDQPRVKYRFRIVMWWNKFFR